MKFRLLPVLILAAILSQATGLFAQDLDNPLIPVQTSKPIYVGPVVGYNYSQHTVDLASFVDDPLCPFFKNGTANGYYVGFSFEYLFGNVKDSRSSIIGRVLYNTMPAGFTKEGDTYPSLVEDPNSPNGYTTVNSSTKHSIDVTFSTITAEFCYKFNFIDNFGFTVGPTFDIPMSKSMEQVYKLVEPDYVQFKRNEEKNYRYDDNDRTIYVFEGDVPDASGFRLGLKAGLQYEILIKRMYIVPAVYYNYAITKFSSKENWYVHALQMGVDVRFAL